MIQNDNKIKMHPNALLQTKNLKDDWTKLCNIQIVNSIIDDLRKHDFEIVNVDGYTSIWDATMYIDNTMLYSSELKLRALYTFAKSGGHILLDDEQIKGNVNLITKLIVTKRITAALAQEFIDESYTESRDS